MGFCVQHLGEAAPLDLLATESGRLAFAFGAAVVVGALGPYDAPLRDPSIADAGRSLRFSGLEPLEALPGRRGAFDRPDVARTGAPMGDAEESEDRAMSRFGGVVNGPCDPTCMLLANRRPTVACR